MKKKTIFVCMLMSFMVMMSGCGKNTAQEDSYIEGQDYQYMLMSEDSFNQWQARGEEGYFFLRGHYIYYLDDATQSMLPLCNKVDCLHDQETNEKKYAECNAYLCLEVASAAGIAYYDGYLYALDELWDDDILYRMKPDGSEREVVYEWENGCVESWLIHRGKMYYEEHYFYEDEETKERIEVYSVKALDIDGIFKEIETVYEPPTDGEVILIDDFSAYGNYLYFYAICGTTDDMDLLLGENWLDYTNINHIICDIRTGELSEVTVPNQTKGEHISSVTFWQDKLIVQAYDNLNEEGLIGEETIYSMNLDGTNPEVLFENVPQGVRILSDGHYLYLSNAALVIRGYEEKQYYEVYNADLELVDVLGMPFETAGDPAIGMQDRMYIFMGTDDENRVELCYFDKSTIGTYDGAPYNLIKITDYITPKANIVEEE